MARLPDPKEGTSLRVRNLGVEYSFWPARKTKRWKLQRRLYVKDPWAILFEAVYRHEPALPKARVQECLSYLGQAEEYFNAASQVERLDVKPVLLYYSLMNLAKCLISVRNPTLDMTNSRHGLTTKPKERAVLGDQISVKKSTRFVNVFDELMRVIEGGTGASFTNLEVRHLLPQVVPGHRLWTYACHKTEKFLAIADIKCYTNHLKRSVWLRLKFNRGKIGYVVPSISSLVRDSHLRGQWQQVGGKESDEATVILEQVKNLRYAHRPIDCLQALFQTLRPALWCTVTSSRPHRKYYLFVDSKLGKKRLPQWASMYVLLFYFSDLTRYRPQHFGRFLESKYGPQIECILDECPRQFLYLMASELLQREVTPAAIV